MTSTVTLLLWIAAGCAGNAGASSSSPTAATSGSESSSSDGPIGLPNERRVETRVVVGGQPDADALARAYERGVRTIISLRTPDEPGFEEERAEAESLGMRFISIPVVGAVGVTPENAAQLDAALSDTGDELVVVHCGSGNRVGAIVALRAFYHQRVSRTAALEMGRAAGLTRLEPAVEAHFEEVCAGGEHPDQC